VVNDLTLGMMFQSIPPSFGKVSLHVLRRVEAMVRRNDTKRHALLSFSHATQHAGALSRHLPRVECVAVTRIVGSVGRSAELGGNFRPLGRARRRHDDSRLERIRTAMAAGESLPPVELHKLGRGYYVVDGHHRIAAALMLGQADVDAIVVEHYTAQGGTMSAE
jgi:hypothetical protein